MRLDLRHSLGRILILLLLPLVGGESFAQWRADSLKGYEQRTLELKPDYSGPVVATLVHRIATGTRHRAVLYVHGYNDYFFQKELGDSIVHHGYSFYALDLRKYGRSLREGQDAFEAKDMTEYQEELSAALRFIRSTEGHSEIYILAHSTGGLITSLYLHDTGNKDGVRGLILNSPFFDFNFSPTQERFIVPLLSSSASLIPNKVVSGVSKEPEMYAQTLLKAHHGRWDYNTNWKKSHGHPIRLSWMRAIREGQKRLQKGLDLRLPILLMTSDRSIRPEKTWRPEYNEADLVLDVSDMWRYGVLLGPDVHGQSIHKGQHDLFLSSDPQAYDMAYRVLFEFLDQCSASTPTH